MGISISKFPQQLHNFRSVLISSLKKSNFVGLYFKCDIHFKRTCEYIRFCI